MGSVDLRLGDNLELLKQMPDNSVDSVVTDPPYGISFMGNKWDYDVPSVELWKEVIRVLKPGGHALVACGTRTQHRMAVNLEDAGFEIRDIVAWIYGQGFPKSLDIGKAISAYEKTGGSSPKNLRKNRLGEDYKPTGQKDYRKGRAFSSEIENDNKETELTENAKQWEGWGTALKPAMELWTLARKPLGEKTVAENVLKYGTGGINIDGCRVGDEERFLPPATPSIGTFNSSFDSDYNGKFVRGRFPANVIHDGSEEVVSLFPYTKSGKMLPKHTRSTDGSPNGIYGKFDINHPLAETYGDEGFASRFFYCAKVSKKERSCNGKVKNNHPTVKPVALMRYLCRLITPPNGVVLDPYMGSGSTGIAALLEGFNFIGMEREEKYMEIAKVRIDAYEEYK